ncbi:hypothetical protein UFOVP660_24 [uncultured Caudovirales phage]|uniref:Uncharacterized protein n=1 Tax=uncultured Caudovirales phage TaxID=2100421 RepID=A0A6J5NK51_9CAUD|nr:hypothetical protein UFOVP660_24 [uncultured Caudovirales phage]
MMVKIVDVNKHGIRREIDHQRKKKVKPNKWAKKGKNDSKDVNSVLGTEAQDK